jgi:hypothetical protein
VGTFSIVADVAPGCLLDENWAVPVWPKAQTVPSGVLVRPEMLAVAGKETVVQV